MTEIDDRDGPSGNGFEYQGTFYRWQVSDMGKDLMLIDRFTGLPVTEFFEIAEDEHERFRGPILLALFACSIRAGHPDWSVERIVRLVTNLSLSDVTYVNVDVEEDTRPPDAPAPEPAPEPNADSSTSTPDGSSSSSTPEETSSYEMSYAAPA